MNEPQFSKLKGTFYIIFILIQMIFFSIIFYGLDLKYSKYYPEWFSMIVKISFPLIITSMSCFYIFNNLTPKIEIPFKIPRLKELSYCVLIGVSLAFLTDFLTLLIPEDLPYFEPLTEELKKILEDFSKYPVAFFYLVVISAPIFEEIIFRGFIQKVLSINTDYKSAIFFTALLFGTIHANPWQLIGGIIGGVVIGFVYWKTKNLVYPITIHFVNNLIGFLMIMNGKTSFYDAVDITSISLFLASCVLLYFTIKKVNGLKFS